MLYLLLCFIPFTTYASDVSYHSGGYYSRVRNVNSQVVNTGDYTTFQTSQQATQESSSQQTSTQSTQYNSGSYNPTYNGGEIRQPTMNPVIVRENTQSSPYRTNIKPVRRESRYSILAHIGLGGQYLYSPGIEYQTLSGSKANILQHSHTYSVMPVGIEFSRNLDRQHSLILGGSYYFNPFRSLVEDTYSNQKIFEGKTQYMLYGKYSYRLGRVLGFYALAGATQMTIDIYNDTTNTLFTQGSVFSPSIGVGATLYATGNASMFVDVIYSHIGTFESLSTTERRLNATSQRSYTALQARVGVTYNITRGLFRL